MCGKVQESRLVGLTPLICILTTQDRLVVLLFSILSPSGSPPGEGGCSG